MQLPPDLETQAIRLAIQRSADDMRMIMQWMLESTDPRQAVRHIHRARELLDEVECNLSRLGG